MVYKDDTSNSAVNFSSPENTRFGEVKNETSDTDLLEVKGLCYFYVCCWSYVLLIVQLVSVTFSYALIWSSATRHVEGGQNKQPERESPTSRKKVCYLIAKNWLNTKWVLLFCFFFFPKGCSWHINLNISWCMGIRGSYREQRCVPVYMGFL